MIVGDVEYDGSGGRAALGKRGRRKGALEEKEGRL